MSADEPQTTPPVGADDSGEPGTPPPSSETAETQAVAGPTNDEVAEAQDAPPGNEETDDATELLEDGSHRTSETGPPIGAGK